jgi:hypothetical protein
MRLIAIDGETWAGEGVPGHVELDPSENVKAAVRQVPAAALVDRWAEPWLSRGVEPPPRTVTDLRGELKKRAREAVKAAPRTQLVPISEYAFEMGIPQRTVRDQIWRGVREAQRNGRGDLALELPVKTPITVRLPTTMPDPRFLLLMAQEGCQPGERHRLGYRRRTDGERWREASRW